MKQLLTTLTCLLAVQLGWSQMEMKLKPRLSLKNTDTVLVSQPPFPIRIVRLQDVDSSLQLSHMTAAGPVYLSRQDGMPCLKPNTAFIYNMPVQTTTGDGVILNGYRAKSKSIPLQK